MSVLVADDYVNLVGGLRVEGLGLQACSTLTLTLPLPATQRSLSPPYPQCDHQPALSTFALTLSFTLIMPVPTRPASDLPSLSCSCHSSCRRLGRSSSRSRCPCTCRHGA